jgi:hypothetical protein
LPIIVFLYYMLLFVFLLLHMNCVREYNKKRKKTEKNPFTQALQLIMLLIWGYIHYLQFNVHIELFVLFVWWCLTQLSTIFQLYRGGHFIGGGNRRTRRKPPNCRKSLTNLIAYCCTPHPDRDSNSQYQWW